MYEQQLKRGVIINTVGMVAKLIHPVFVISVTWLFGTDIAGLYFLAYFIGEFVASVATTGYNDAATIFASPLVEDPERRDKLYQVFANAFVVTLLISGMAIGVTYLGAEWLITTLYPDRPELIHALHILAWMLPFAAILSISIAATKALMLMEYEAALNGFVRPVIQLACTIVAWLLDAGLPGLMWTQVVSYVIAAGLGLWAFTSHFSLSSTLSAVLRVRLDWEMVRFALPQNLQMTINRYLTRIDVIMLGAFGIPNHQLAFYSTAALITSNLREVRLVFSGVLGPVLARHHARGERREFQEQLGRVARWTTSLAAPLVLVLLVLRDDVLLVFHKSFVGDTLFMVVLLLAPYVNCAFGLAANVIVYTKHSVWNLFNTVLVAGLNTGFNLLLIPELGMLGAALGTAIAATLVAALQLIEIHLLERVTIPLHQVYKAHLGFLAMLSVCALVWDPAHLDGFAVRLAFAAALVIGYGAILAALRDEDVVALISRARAAARRGRFRNR